MKELLKKRRSGYDVALGMEAADEFETLRKRVAALEKVLDREKNDYRNLRSRLTGKLGAATKRAEKAEARIAELERSNDNLRQIERNVQAVREHDFQRAEKAEAALTEARARLAAADRMADAMRMIDASVFNDNGDVTYDTGTMAKAHSIARVSLKEWSAEQ